MTTKFSNSNNALYSPKRENEWGWWEVRKRKSKEEICWSRCFLYTKGIEVETLNLELLFPVVLSKLGLGLGSSA